MDIPAAMLLRLASNCAMAEAMGDVHSAKIVDVSIDSDPANGLPTLKVRIDLVPREFCTFIRFDTTAFG